MDFKFIVAADIHLDSPLTGLSRGGIDREAFTRIFGLSRDELVSGGWVILEGKGGVGESLFAAGLGGADLKKVLDTLDSEAGDLFKPTGTLPRLNAEAKAFKELKTGIRDLSLLPKDWEELAGTVSAFEERSRELRDRIARLSAAEDRMKRLRDALPLMAELRVGEQKRAELGEVKILRKGFVLERRQAQTEMNQALSEEKTAKKRIEEIERISPGLRGRCSKPDRPPRQYSGSCGRISIWSPQGYCA